MDEIGYRLLQFGMAVLVGGLIGAEREYHDKAAGFRTIILITLGATLFTIFSMTMDPDVSKTRVAANIVTGIGFLGAGAIIRNGERIAGLTTAATIWLSAALGMGIGAGEFALVAVATAVTCVILLVFPKIEIWIDRIRESREYRVSVSLEANAVERVMGELETCSLRILEHHQTKSETCRVARFIVTGKPSDHHRFVEMMLADKSIREFDY